MTLRTKGDIISLVGLLGLLTFQAHWGVQQVLNVPPPTGHFMHIGAAILPYKVKICGPVNGCVEYQVIYNQPPGSLGTGITGDEDYENSLIRIVRTNSLWDIKGILVHESMHATLDEWGMHEQDTQVMTLHQWIYFSSYAWIRVLEDNPDLVRWLANPDTIKFNPKESK